MFLSKLFVEVTHLCVSHPLLRSAVKSWVLEAVATFLILLVVFLFFTSQQLDFSRVGCEIDELQKC